MSSKYDDLQLDEDIEQTGELFDEVNKAAR